MEPFDKLVDNLSLKQCLELLYRLIEIKDRMYLNNYYRHNDNDKELEDWFEIIIPQLKEYIKTQVDDL